MPVATPSSTDLAGPMPNQPTANRLAGRVCLVVGGTRGIGRAIALRMAAEGAAAVAVSGRNAMLGEQLAEELDGLGAESLFVPADVTREAELALLVEQTGGAPGSPSAKRSPIGSASGNRARNACRKLLLVLR